MKTTTPLLMATQSQTSTGAFSVKQLIDSRSVTHLIAHASLSPSFFHFSYQSLMTAQHMSTSSHFSRVHMSIGHCVPLSLQGWAEKVKCEEWSGSGSEISISPQGQGQRQVDVLMCMSDSPLGLHKLENLQMRKLIEGEIAEVRMNKPTKIMSYVSILGLSHNFVIINTQWTISVSSVNFVGNQLCLKLQVTHILKEHCTFLLIKKFYFE